MLQIAVYVAPMPKLDHEHEAAFVMHLVENAIISHPETVAVRFATELLYARSLARVFAELTEGLGDASLDFARKVSQFTLRAG